MYFSRRLLTGPSTQAWYILFSVFWKKQNLKVPRACSTRFGEENVVWLRCSEFKYFAVNSVCARICYLQAKSMQKSLRRWLSIHWMSSLACSACMYRKRDGCGSPSCWVNRKIFLLSQHENKLPPPLRRSQWKNRLPLDWVNTVISYP